MRFIYNFLLITRQASDNIWSHCSTSIHTGSNKCVHHGIRSFACWNESFRHNILILWSLCPRLIIGWFRIPAFPHSLKVYSDITKSSCRIRLGDSSRISCHESRRIILLLVDTRHTGHLHQTFTRIFGRILISSGEPHHFQNLNIPSVTYTNTQYGRKPTIDVLLPLSRPRCILIFLGFRYITLKLPNNASVPQSDTVIQSS